MEDKDQEQQEVGEREAMQKWMGWGQRLGEKVENKGKKGMQRDQRAGTWEEKPWRGLKWGKEYQGSGPGHPWQ